MIGCAPYVLVTAACNEGRFIESTIRSVVAQELHPARWVIVSDNSNDDTDAIVEKYAATHGFIQLHRLTEDHPRNFAAQVYAINAGIAQLRGTEYAFIGNLDADITFDSCYFRNLLEKFRHDARLGIGGGTIYERCGDIFRSRKANSTTSVAHAVQLFRRECFEALGGAYLPLPYGAPDTCAEVMARVKGWHVASFSDLIVFHHRPTGSAGGLLHGCFRKGRMDYSIGTLPLFEVLKLLRRVPTKPYLIGSVARLVGFLQCYCRGEQRAVSEEFMTCLRKEQAERLRSLLQPK
jgi:hypothetical protein